MEFTKISDMKLYYKSFFKTAEIIMFCAIFLRGNRLNLKLAEIFLVIFFKYDVYLTTHTHIYVTGKV
jgi:hypothetical protein